MKKLKRYLEFLKESLETASIWKIDENKIREFLIELEDSEYIILVTFGFVGTKAQHFYNRPTEYTEVFTEKILANELTNLAISIEIQARSKTSNVDVTDDFLAALSAIELECDADIELYDNGGKLNPDELLIKGGIFTGVEPDDEYSGTEIEGSLFVFVKFNNQIKFNPKQLSDFYGWKCDEETEDNIYVHVDLEDMADYILTYKCQWEKTLVAGSEALWDHYDISGYYPDINSLFQYTLDKDNANLLIKSMIKEAGGLEDIKRHIGDECDNDVYDKVKEMSEEELIDYLINKNNRYFTERYRDTLKQLGKNSEIFRDINHTVADWELSAHVHDNYQELLSEFDRCVSDEFKFTKFKKEVEKSWKAKSTDGNEVIHKYTEEETFYRIQFDNKWIEDTNDERDDAQFYGLTLRSIFREYCENLERYDLNPRFSDYGHVDSKLMNSEINAILNKFLSK
jgi:ribosomal protein L29